MKIIDPNYKKHFSALVVSIGQVVIIHSYSVQIKCPTTDGMLMPSLSSWSEIRTTLALCSRFLTSFLRWKLEGKFSYSELHVLSPLLLKHNKQKQLCASENVTKFKIFSWCARWINPLANYHINHKHSCTKGCSSSFLFVQPTVQLWNQPISRVDIYRSNVQYNLKFFHEVSKQALEKENVWMTETHLPFWLF